MHSSRTSIFLRGLFASVLLFAAACETMPVQEMSDARQAIMAARDAGAETHAMEELAAAEKYLSSAEEYLNSRDYAIARRDAIEAKTRALDALRRSEASRETEN